MSKREGCMRYLLLVVGTFFIGLGVALGKHSGLGVSAVSSVANVISIKFPIFTVGTWMMIWYALMIFAQIAILRKGFKPLQFLQFPIALLLGVFTDLGTAMISWIPVEMYIVRLVFVLLGMVTLAFGIALTLVSDTVMGVAEAFVAVVADVLHKNFGHMKVAVDISCVVLSMGMSLLFFDFTLVGVREGTILTACSTGFVVKLLTKRIKTPIARALWNGK